MLQFMVAYLEACLSDFYLAATGVYIWIPFSETGSTDIPCVAYVCEFLVSRVTKEDYGAPVLGCTFWAAVASPASCFVVRPGSSILLGSSFRPEPGMQAAEL